MKKVLILAITAVMSLGAKAQLISSNTATRETVKPLPVVTQAPKSYKNYNRIGFSYNSISYGITPYDDDDYEAIFKSSSGVSLDILKGISISSSLPLYIETGLGITFGWKSINDYDYDEYRDYKYEYEYTTKYTYLDLRVPLNLTYRYEVIDGLKISPFIGLYLKGNLLGNIKEEWTYSVNGSVESADEDSYNIYDEEDMGEGGTATRFNIGIDFGVNVDYKNFYFGLSYAKDFNNFFDKGVKPFVKKSGSMGRFAVTLGFVY